MFVFKSEINNAYIATNPKVLTRTLYQQENLKRYTSKLRYIHFCLNGISTGLGPEYIFLVRNPYARIESFFKEKLRQKVKMVLNEDNPYKLKRHQEVFYPFIGLDEHTKKNECVDKLLNFSFDEFIDTLPEVYLKEDHLSPQLHNYHRKIFGVKWQIVFNRTIQIENKMQMKWLSDYLNLNFEMKINSSIDKSNEINWSRKNVAIVNKLYHRDLELLGYKLK